MPDRKVVIVDDEADVRLPLRRFLLGKGYAVLEADSVASVRALLGQESVDAAVVDFSLPDGDGLDVLRSVKAQDASVPVVLLTGHGSIDLAVKAIKEGAEQFFTKPVELPALLVVVERALENRRMRQVSLAGKSVQARQAVDPFFGESAVIRKLAADAARIVASTVPVLVCGETGTGKGVLARWLHQNGPRAEEPFVDLNCAGLSKDLLETELFGHEKGAFTGAVAAKPGLLEIAHRGTMFLDEIGDVDLQVQAKLLKVVEDLRYRRLGDVRDRQVDVRLVERISAEMGRPGVRLSGAAEQELVSRAWPGNVRQLRNVLERALLLSDHSTLSPADVADASPAAVPLAAAGASSRITLAEAERRHIEAVLREERGAVASAAEVLGLSRSALYERIKKFGIVTAKGTES